METLITFYKNKIKKPCIDSQENAEEACKKQQLSYIFTAQRS